MESGQNHEQNNCRLQYAGITNRLIDNQQIDQIVYDIVFATPVKVNHTLSGDKVSPKKGYKLFIGTSI